MANQVTEYGVWAALDVAAVAAFSAAFSSFRFDGAKRQLEERLDAVERENRELKIQLSVAQTTSLETRRQLEHSDRMAVLGMATAYVAHEINNPLFFVLLNLPRIRQLLPAAGVPLSADVLTELTDTLNDAEEGVARIQSIALELKSFSKRRPGELERLDVRDAVRSSLIMVGGLFRDRARFEERHDPTPPVKVSRVRLVQVLVNLLRNSLEAFPERRTGNVVRVATGTTPDGDAFIRVEDNGPGIPEELLSRVFDPFFSTKPAHVGTGLGLAICREIVLDLGGQIRAASDQEHGALFEVTLPAADGPRPTPLRLVASGDPS